MRCTLMNKNTAVLVAEYDVEVKTFSEIIEVKNIDYAPVILKKSYITGTNFRTDLSDWFRGRGIPSFRDDLDLLLARLDVTTPEQLLDKAFGLSLSDQYWVKPTDSNIEYKDINFFEHDFEDSDFTTATFSNTGDSSIKVSLISPNNTTDGRLKKTWIIDGGKRCLLKGGYKAEVMQPFNEVLASMICKRLGFNHAEYTIDITHDKVVSKCECFINSDTELVSAYQILHGKEKKYGEEDFDDYVKILTDNGIDNAREKIENMFILDYLMLNEDRHLNNFGIIRDVNTLKWLDVAPIFDTGQSLNILDYNDEEMIINGQGRFFYNIDSFDNIIPYIEDIHRFDFSKLDGVVEEFDDLLHMYQNVTRMTDRRINKICTLLLPRINKLKNMI